MIKIDINTEQIWNAANWLRNQLGNLAGESIKDEFEKEFNCRVVFDFETSLACEVEFDSEKSLTMFLLKWSK